MENVNHVDLLLKEAEGNPVARRSHGGSANVYRRRGGLGSRTSLKQSYDTMSEASQMTQESQASHVSSTRSVPVQVSSYSGFAWPKRETHSRHQKYSSGDPSNALHPNDAFDSGRFHRNEAPKLAMLWEQEQLHQPDSFDSSDAYEPQGFYTVSLLNYTSIITWNNISPVAL